LSEQFFPVFSSQINPAHHIPVDNNRRAPDQEHQQQQPSPVPIDEWGNRNSHGGNRRVPYPAPVDNLENPGTVADITGEQGTGSSRTPSALFIRTENVLTIVLTGTAGCSPVPVVSDFVTFTNLNPPGMFSHFIIPEFRCTIQLAFKKPLTCTAAGPRTAGCSVLLESSCVP
jgi:hypothetical protein